MRTIKFRGKNIFRNINTGEWAIGYYQKTKLKDPTTGKEVISHLIHEGEWMFEVDPNTLGQFIGSCDMKGVPIYEGDIVDNSVLGICKVEYSIEAASYMLVDKRGLIWRKEGWNYVIGNIHDNPELMKWR